MEIKGTCSEISRKTSRPCNGLLSRIASFTFSFVSVCKPLVKIDYIISFQNIFMGDGMQGTFSLLHSCPKLLMS